MEPEAGAAYKRIVQRLAAASYNARAAQAAANSAAEVTKDDIWSALGDCMGTGYDSARRCDPPQNPNKIPRLLGFFQNEGVLTPAGANQLLDALGWDEAARARLDPRLGLSVPRGGSDKSSDERNARFVSRRTVLKGAVGIAGVAATGPRGLRLSRKTGRRLVGLGSRNSYFRGEVDLGTAVMSLFQHRSNARMLGVWAGNEHPGWPDTVNRHPSNLLPADTTMAALPVAWNDTLQVHGAAADLLSFGSTISNAAGRNIFSTDNWLELPYTYFNDASQHDIVWRWVGGTWYPTTLRAISMGGSLGLMVPKYARSNEPFAFGTESEHLVLDSDILLITAIPNPYDESAFRNDGRLLLVGGVHGTATESFPSIITEPRIYSEIRNRIGDAKFFQVAVQINKIHHAKPGEDGRSWGDPESFKVLDHQRLSAEGLYRRVIEHNGWQELRGDV